MPPPCRRQEDSQGLRPPTPVCFTGEGHWPLRGAKVAGVQPSAQGQLVLQGWAPLQAGVTDRCLDTGQPGRLALPLGQPLPVPVPAQALGPCLPGSQSPSLKPCSEVRTTRSPRSGRGSRWGGGAGRGLVCWPHCTQPSRRPRPVPEGPQLPARPSPRWPSSRGRRTPSVFSGGPSQEGSQVGQGQKDPRTEFQDNLGLFLPQTNEAQTTLSQCWGGPGRGASQIPQSFTSPSAPTLWSTHRPQSPEQRPLWARGSQPSARLRLPREGVPEARRERRTAAVALASGWVRPPGFHGSGGAEAPRGLRRPLSSREGSG